MVSSSSKIYKPYKPFVIYRTARNIEGYAFLDWPHPRSPLWKIQQDLVDKGLKIGIRTGYYREN